MLDFLNGKKTYLIALIAGVCAVAQSLGYEIPEYVYAILGSLGLATQRAAIGKI